MKLFLISQTENDDYDTYDSAVVCAQDEDEARNIQPGCHQFGDKWSDWCSSPEKVTVKCVGEAADGIDRGVVCASFNAG